MLVFEDLPETHEDVYSLKRSQRFITYGEGPYESVKTLTKVARTSGLSILKDIMGLEAEHVSSESSRSSIVTPLGNHGKILIIKTPFHSVSSMFSTSSIPPQPYLPPYMPFGTISITSSKPFSTSKSITTSMPSNYVKILILSINFVESATIITFTPPTLNACTTSLTTPISKPYDTVKAPSDSGFSTPTSFPLTMPEAHAFPYVIYPHILIPRNTLMNP